MKHVKWLQKARYVLSVVSFLALVSVFAVSPASADTGSYTADANGQLTFSPVAGVTISFGFPLTPTISCGAVDIDPGLHPCPESGGGTASTTFSFDSGLEFTTHVSGSGPPASSSAFLGGEIDALNMTGVDQPIVFTLTWSFAVSHSGNAGAGGGVNVTSGLGSPLFDISFPPPSVGSGSGTRQFNLTIPASATGPSVEVIAMGVGVGGAVAAPEPAGAMWPVLAVALGLCALLKFKKTVA